MPKPLNVDRIKQFERSPNAVEDTTQANEYAAGERWLSREPIRDGQISIKAPIDVLNRFKRICKDDRRTYADMLRILMDLYESKK